MKEQSYELFFRYFAATVGRFYTYEEKKRLLKLFIGGGGFFNCVNDYEKILATSLRIEEAQIENYTDSKNYLMLCDFLGCGEIDCSAAEALVDVYKAVGSRGPTYVSYVDWIISLRTDKTKSQGALIESAYYNYAMGNLEEAISDYKDLINRADLTAVSDLAFIYAESDKYEEAFYYYSLLKDIYTKELRISVSNYIDMQISFNCEKLDEEKRALVIREVEERAPFILKEGGKSIGFLNNGSRRFTYER